MKKKIIILSAALLIVCFVYCTYHAFYVIGYKCTFITNAYKHQHETYGAYCYVPKNPMEDPDYYG